MYLSNNSAFKVGVRLIWSSQNQKFIGHSMTREELTTLCDVYLTLNPEFRQKQTSYILQTLWRDLTSQVSMDKFTNVVFHSAVEHLILIPTTFL